MKRLAELKEEPEVGKYYLVPCVIDGLGAVVPVLGPKHDDADFIGLEVPHYHYDLRFLSERLLIERYGADVASRNLACSVEQFAMGVVLADVCEPLERPMRCRRRMPVFPVRLRHFPLHWLEEMEAAYAKTKLDCARCPHRGFPLSEGLADQNGVVVCPGHGLAWNIKTGRLVSRLNKGHLFEVE